MIVNLKDLSINELQISIQLLSKSAGLLLLFNFLH
ncbi:hypothetical protein M622_00035 [Thauera terpenica 58Eu]|uniref:Uncharacterized protein n=1 Tax=Thauera terpenica 58Eu TaxID=1348657 RepID=T0B328_9RHOO|nr:hypothetical protein M622_00035 [Thauera terpenica 58Eu]